MIEVKIDSVVQKFSQNTLEIEWGFTNEPGKARFVVKDSLGDIIGSRVDIEQDSVLIWSGTVVNVNQIVDGMLKVYRVEVSDNNYDFDRKKVAKSYNDTNAKVVVEDIVDNFTDGFTTNAVQGEGISIKTLRANYEEPSRMLSKLADEINWKWYVDKDKDVHFFPPGYENAPFNLTDENGKYFWRSLWIDTDILDMKNRVFVRGGELKQAISEANAIDKYEADGETKTFPLFYKYSGVGVTVGGDAQTVGVDPIDEQRLQDDDVDVLYRFNPSAIRFKEDLTAGSIVRVFGDAHIPIIIDAQDDESILERGERQHFVLRRDVESIEEAQEIANATLEKFKKGTQSGSFITQEDGLRPGQKINIQSDERGIDDDFIIYRVGAVDSGSILEYRVDFISTSKIEFMDIMERLLENEKRNIEISPNEKVQRTRSVDDSFGASDNPVEFETTSMPYVYGEKGDELGDKRDNKFVGIAGFSKMSK